MLELSTFLTLCVKHGFVLLFLQAQERKVCECEFFFSYCERHVVRKRPFKTEFFCNVIYLFVFAVVGNVNFLSTKLCHIAEVGMPFREVFFLLFTYLLFCLAKRFHFYNLHFS